MSKPRETTSTSAIDCICCALGGAILLWLATIAATARQSVGVQSILLVEFTFSYSGAAVAGNQGSNKASEIWSLNGQSLAEFEIGIVKPIWADWQDTSPAFSTNFSFASRDPGVEVVTFFGSAESSQNTQPSNQRVYRRSILIQNAERPAKMDVEVQWLEKPNEVSVRVVANGHDTISARLESKEFSEKGFRQYIEPGQLAPAEALP